MRIIVVWNQLSLRVWQGARCILIQTKEVTVQATDITRIFGTDGSVSSSASKGCSVDLPSHNWPRI